MGLQRAAIYESLYILKEQLSFDKKRKIYYFIFKLFKPTKTLYLEDT